jgi:MFS family permease
MRATDSPRVPPDKACAGGSRPDMRAVGRGLDWLNLFVANIQTGFGPFIAVYLTTQGWTQTQIGFALSIGTLTAMASQVPAGALVDAVPNKYAVGFFSILAFTGSALLFALWPIQLSVYAAEVLHGFSSCTLGPVIAAISLAIAGPAGFSLRLGRNVRFSSIGNGLGAILMGICGYLLSERAVFFLTAALTLPALAALGPLFRAGSSRRPPRSAPPRTREPSPDVPAQPLSRVLADRRLLIFAACAALFTFANSPMLPLVSGEMTRLAPADATLLVAACIVLPQIVVAALSPSVGRIAQTGGRRIILLLAFATLPVRGLLFALIANPQLMVIVQALDGIAAACFGIMVPLVISDLAGRSGHFNFALGLVGFAIGIGATLSTPFAGWVSDRLGIPAAFACLALAGLAATVFVWAAMPETRPENQSKTRPLAGPQTRP